MKRKKNASVKTKYIVGIAIPCVLVIALILGFLHPSKNKADTTEGRAILSAMESRDLSTEETKIQNVRDARAAEKARIAAEAQAAAEAAAEAEKAEAQAAAEAAAAEAEKAAAEAAAAAQSSSGEEYNFKEMFSHAMIMGDSVSKGIEYCDMVYASNIQAETGASVFLVTDDMIAQVAAMHPKDIFLYYGFNDVASAHGDLDWFYVNYFDFLQRLTAACPNSHIYINALFPVLHLETLQNADYADLTPYNQLIERLCSEFGCTYMDNTDLVRPEYYYADGYHFRVEFYPLWMTRMAQYAGYM